MGSWNLKSFVYFSLVSFPVSKMVVSSLSRNSLAVSRDSLMVSELARGRPEELGVELEDEDELAELGLGVLALTVPGFPAPALNVPEVSVGDGSAVANTKGCLLRLLRLPSIFGAGPVRCVKHGVREKVCCKGIC
jgi:hypothetical protein